MKFKLNFKKSTRCLLSTFIALVFIISCRKEADTNSVVSEKSLNELVSWYENQLTKNNVNEFEKMAPNWNKVTITEKSDKNIYEVKLNNKRHFFLASSEESLAKNKARKATDNVKLLIFRDKVNQKTIYGCYMVIESVAPIDFAELHYKNMGSLTGTVYFYHLDGTLSNAWKYERGLVTHKMTPISREQFELSRKVEKAGSTTMGFECTDIQVPKMVWACAGVAGYENCSWMSGGFEWTTTCVYNNDEEQGEDSGGGDNGGYSPPMDCLGVPYGTASTDNCGNCVGGTTGLTACLTELKTDSVKKKYPCADTLILQAILKSPIMSKFVEPFLTPQRPTVTYLTDNTLDWGSATTGGTFMLGNNRIDPNSYTGLSSVVRFNEKMLQNSSQLLIAATVVHETLHAYINYNVTMANSNYSNYYSDNWMLGLNNFYLMVNLPANYSNHTMMLEDYFDKSMAVLQAWNAKQGFIYSTKNMAMAMLYGLDRYETGTSQALINNINSAFQAVKVKYNISTSDLTSFNNANLFSSTNKLPTTGCN